MIMQPVSGTKYWWFYDSGVVEVTMLQQGFDPSSGPFAVCQVKQEDVPALDYRISMGMADGQVRVAFSGLFTTKNEAVTAILTQTRNDIHRYSLDLSILQNRLQDLEQIETELKEIPDA